MEYVRDHRRSDARKILRARADQFGSMVHELKARGFAIDENIDLKTEHDLGRDYEASTIAYKFYPRGTVPPDAEISADLEPLLQAYEKLLLSKEPSRKTWIFQANPEFFDIDGALSELDELSWLVNQHAEEIHEGDRVFSWRSGSQGGIVATGTILTEPHEFESLPEEKEFNRDAEKFEGLRTRVRIKIGEIVSPVLTRSEIAAV
jgi:MrcB-like, N-terminal domain/EVE domain